MKSSNKERGCRCKEISCPKDCSRSHTHKTVFCEKCEPEAVKQMYPKVVPQEIVSTCLCGKVYHGDCEPQVSSWEQRFDDEFRKRLGGLYDFHTNPQDNVPNDCTEYVETFIKNELKQAYKEGYEAGQHRY